jgi:hypothetical protein
MGRSTDASAPEARSRRRSQSCKNGVTVSPAVSLAVSLSCHSVTRELGVDRARSGRMGLQDILVRATTILAVGLFVSLAGCSCGSSEHVLPDSGLPDSGGPDASPDANGCSGNFIQCGASPSVACCDGVRYEFNDGPCMLPPTVEPSACAAGSRDAGCPCSNDGESYCYAAPSWNPSRLVTCRAGAWAYTELACCH